MKILLQVKVSSWQGGSLSGDYIRRANRTL